ncbi:MAG: glycerophosphodiester phosphodiesterase family protein, partial [Verrucomicrobiota bacterium]
LPELERAIKASGKKNDQLLIITFGYETVKAAKQRFPGIEAYWLYGWKKDAETKRAYTPDEIIEKAKAAGVDAINLSYKGPIDAAFVKKAKAAGLKFYVWTVDEVDVAKQLLDAGVDGITTNRPQWLREQLGL